MTARRLNKGRSHSYETRDTNPRRGYCHSRQFTSEGVTKTRKGKQVTTFFDRRLSREECERTLRVMGVQE